MRPGPGCDEAPRLAERDLPRQTGRASVRGMYLNLFADGADPLDMTGSDEFRSLLASASDLKIPHAPDVRYRSRNIVLRRMRFHVLEWGEPDAPPIVLLHGGHQSAHSWDLV